MKGGVCISGQKSMQDWLSTPFIGETGCVTGQARVDNILEVVLLGMRYGIAKVPVEVEEYE